MDAFRNVYGLDPDGADDALDWSENGIANILYFAFGLGDPNLTDVDYTRLPQLETSDSTDTIVFSYVHPSGSNHGIIATVATSEDLADWFTPAELGSGYLPVSEETEDLGEGYERISETYGMNGESRRFYRLSVRSAR
jgi:hypothetical protein